MTDEQVVKAVIDCHPKGCVFMPGAAKRIAERLGPWGQAWADHRLLKLAFRLEEIYCPHEPGRFKTWC